MTAIFSRSIERIEFDRYLQNGMVRNCIIHQTIYGLFQLRFDLLTQKASRFEDLAYARLDKRPFPVYESEHEIRRLLLSC